MAEKMFLLLVVASFPVVRAAIPNVLCMLEHCASQMKDCYEDSDCKTAMVCMIGCGTSNQTCVFNCFFSYENEIFDNFMKCIVTDYRCMEIPPLNPPVKCHRPTNIQTTFEIKSLIGSWVIVLGMNQIYDCFNCQNTTYIQAHDGLFSAVERYDIKAIDGTIKHRTTFESIAQWNATTPGILKYNSRQMGLEIHSEWRVLDYGTDYIFAYYCGSISSNYFYEGAVVYSKSVTLSNDTLSKLKKVATDAGLDLNTFCKPLYNSC